MNDRPDTLELELRGLALAVEWPPTPDIRMTVRAGIEAQAARPRRAWWTSPLRLTRPALIAIVLLVLAVAVAAAIVLGLPGLRVSVVHVLPTPNVPAASVAVSPSGSTAPSAPATLTLPPGANLDLGQSVTLEAASAALGSPVLLPDLPGRAAPDGIYLDRLRDGAVVTLIWRAGPDLPPATPGSDVGLLVTQFEAEIDQGLLTKLISQGTKIERVVVLRHLGLWITGAEHVVWFQRPNGDAIESVIRLVGDTLAVDWDGRIVRLESALGRDRSLELARTFH